MRFVIQGEMHNGIGFITHENFFTHLSDGVALSWRVMPSFQERCEPAGKGNKNNQRFAKQERLKEFELPSLEG